MTRGSGCAITAGAGASPSSGAVSGAACAEGSGEVEVGVASSLSVTVTRSTGGISGGDGGRRTSTATSAAWAAIATTSPAYSSRRSVCAAIVTGYCCGSEPGMTGSEIAGFGTAAAEVTSEIAVKPARLSSPITAITRP